MKRRFRIITTTGGDKYAPGRKLYIVAKNTNEVRAALAKNGLMAGERVSSITAIANVGEAAGVLTPAQGASA
jgi:hypothetical protein